MNYRHAFHAGNHADVLKHLALVYCLDYLKRKDAPFAVLDTHAGTGLYDLSSSEAQRSPEWKDGIGKIWDWPDAPPSIGAYRDAIASFNADGALINYPGSPALIAHALREQDRLAAIELHPDDAQTLRRTLAPHANAQIHARDGYEAMKALLPFAERRGLILIDPPYEESNELETATTAINAALKRFAHATYLWWRPLKSNQSLSSADADLAAPALRADLWIADINSSQKLAGSSLAIINPPFGLEDALREALPALARRLDIGGGGWRLK